MSSVTTLQYFANRCRAQDAALRDQVDDQMAIDMFFDRLQQATKKRKREDVCRPTKVQKKAKKRGKKKSIVRVLSAYVLFCAEQRGMIQKESPEISFAALGQELGRRWHAADQSVRDRFEEQSRSQRPPPPSAEELQLRKRAATSFMLFSNERRQAIRTAHPEWKLGQVATELGRAWGKLSAEEKQVYTEAHRRQHETLGAQRAEIIRQQSTTPKVTKPLSSFFMFSKVMRPAVCTQFPDMTGAQIAQRLGERWNALSENQRAMYGDKALVQHLYGDLTLPTDDERSTLSTLTDEQWQERFQTHINEMLTRKEALTEWSEKRLRKVLSNVYGDDYVHEYKSFIKDIIKARVQALLVES